MDRQLSDVILSVEHVSKAFPGVKALDDVSLQVGRGVVDGDDDTDQGLVHRGSTLLSDGISVAQAARGWQEDDGL